LHLGGRDQGCGDRDVVGKGRWILMTKAIRIVLNTQTVLDEKIYPRAEIDHRRIALFTENMRDGSEIEPIDVQVHRQDYDKYRILDGAHRLNTYNEIGAAEIPVHIITLDGIHPPLYAAQKVIGPLQLTEEEARITARRAFEQNPKLTPAEIGKP